jgi:hypothetical protein
MTHPVPAFDFLIQYPNVRDFTMTADGNEAYFTIQNPLEELAIIVRMTKNKNKWSEPAMVPFTGNYRDIEPSLSPDGLRLYFSSDRPTNATSTESKDYDIWYVERKDVKSAWSAPINIGAPVNTDKDEFYPSVTRLGNIYFTSERDGGVGKDDIFISTWNGKYSSPTPLGKAINTPGLEFNAYIEPNEKYIIYTGYARPGNVGSGDLFISYKSKDGAWSESQSLGAVINSKYMDYCPFVDQATNTLYFTSRRSDISKNNFKNLDEFDQVIHQYENGFSRMYKISIASVLANQ